MHHVYIIESNSGKWYIGYTTDLRRRMQEHNDHKNLSTSKDEEWHLIYCESYVEKMDALGRERYLKSGSGRRFLKKQMKHYLERQSCKA